VKVSDAWMTTHIETDIAPATHVGSAVSGALARQQMRTWRIVPVTRWRGVREPLFVGGLAVPQPRPRERHAHDRAHDDARRARVRVTVHDLRGALAPRWRTALAAARRAEMESRRRAPESISCAPGPGTTCSPAAPS
jgi:hypothetical protein